jgi:predicted TIM-barrel fold metal-dependent hydrolase
VDLSDLPVIDGHCHPLLANFQVAEGAPDADIERYRSLLTESEDEEMATVHAASAVSYRRLLRALGSKFGVDAELGPDAEVKFAVEVGHGTEPGTHPGGQAPAGRPEWWRIGTYERRVLAARSPFTPAQLAGKLLGEANLEALLVDTGYPPADQAMPLDELGSATGVAVHEILRLEPLMEHLLARPLTLAEVEEALREIVRRAPDGGVVGLKSIVAYRSGFHLGTHSSEAFRDRAWRQIVTERMETGRVHLSGHIDKAILDHLLLAALSEAARLGLPVQFHVGYGDADVDLQAANPLGLRSLFEDPSYRTLPVVLLHGCWPYTREGAFLSALYGNAYLDVSYAIPYLSQAEQRAMTAAALAAAPLSKVLYSSDGVRLPELHWLGARDGRAALGSVLEEMVVDGDLDAQEALRAAEAILAGNVRRLYGLG